MINYLQYGARLYDSRTGRFLSVDPMFEQFREHTPYHYAFNSPVQWRDPSGLYPVDEKGERVQAEEYTFSIDFLTEMMEMEMAAQENSQLAQLQFKICSMMADFWIDKLSRNYFDDYDIGGRTIGGLGGSSSGGRTSGDQAENGNEEKENTKTETKDGKVDGTVERNNNNVFNFVELNGFVISTSLISWYANAFDIDNNFLYNGIEGGNFLLSGGYKSKSGLFENASNYEEIYFLSIASFFHIEYVNKNNNGFSIQTKFGPEIKTWGFGFMYQLSLILFILK